jgi:hypothetical protein
VRDGQPSPHRPQLVVSRSTCPPISPSPHANSFVLGPAVINTHTPAGGWACTSNAGVLGLIPKREEPGKTGRPPVLKYWVTHGSQREQLYTRCCSLVPGLPDPNLPSCSKPNVNLLAKMPMSTSSPNYQCQSLRQNAPPTSPSLLLRLVAPVQASLKIVQPLEYFVAQERKQEGGPCSSGIKYDYSLLHRGYTETTMQK